MKHTFVICAYQESPYIEACIQSLKSQEVSSGIRLATSTPSDYLRQLCEQYDVSYHVRDGVSGIAEDWNYALSVADTPYVTIAHQDDVYEPAYAKSVYEMIRYHENHQKDFLIAFTDYSELVKGQKHTKRRNLIIKRMLLFPLKAKWLQNIKFWKRQAIRFGNGISCPTVTYNKQVIQGLVEQQGRANLFIPHFRSNLDWETWEWLSRFNGSFCYIPKVLMAHRIHEDSETTATIQANMRGDEDFEMFCKFWPRGIAKRLTGTYGASEKSNQID